MIELNKTYPGNALEILKQFPDEYFHCCITSPPYLGLRSYNTEPQIWEDRRKCNHEWQEEIITNNSGGGWNNPETRHQYPTMRLRDPAKENKSKVSQGCYCKHCMAWKGELGLEPKPELYLDHLLQIFTEVKRVLRKDGTLFVNLGDKTDNKGMLQLPHRFSIMMVDELKFILRRNIIWHKPGIMPTSQKDNFSLDYEDIFFFTKSQKYYFEQPLEEAMYDGRKDTMFKGSKKYDNPNISPDGAVNTFAKEGHERWMEVNGKKMRIMRSVWTIPSEAIIENHYATYPQKLVERIIRYSCPEEICNKCNTPALKVFVGKGGGIGESMHDHKDNIIKGMRATNKKAKGGHGYHRIEEKIVCNCYEGFHPGVVLDPFIGSGTTGIVARKLNRNYVGIDLAYHQINEDRTNKELGFFR